MYVYHIFHIQTYIIINKVKLCTTVRRLLPNHKRNGTATLHKLIPQHWRQYDLMRLRHSRFEGFTVVLDTGTVELHEMTYWPMWVSHMGIWDLIFGRNYLLSFQEARVIWIYIRGCLALWGISWTIGGVIVINSPVDMFRFHLIDALFVSNVSRRI